LAGGATIFPRTALAQSTIKLLRVGTVKVIPRSVSFLVAFERRMAELGSLGFFEEPRPASRRRHRCQIPQRDPSAAAQNGGIARPGAQVARTHQRIRMSHT
jgi:hypothetical protein